MSRGLNMVSILTILKFVGLAIGLASSVWGMTTKTTFEDQAGRKRLTPAGHVVIALAMGAFLVAATSQGFEVLAKQAQERDSRAQKAMDAARQEALAASAFRSEQRGKRVLDIQMISRAEALSAASDTRARQAEQRLLSLTAMAEQRKRGIALSSAVYRGSAANLAKAEVTLTQLQRALHPIEELSVEVTWCIPGNTPGLKEIIQPLATYRTPAGVIYEEGIREMPLPGRRFITVEPSYKLYPTVGSSMGTLGMLLTNGTTFVDFNLGMGKGDPFGILHGKPDIRFNIGDGARSNVSYYERTGDVLFKAFAKPKTDQMIRSGQIVSVEDLEKSNIVINLLAGRTRTYDGDGPDMWTLLDAATPIDIQINASGKRYNLYAWQIKKLEDGKFGAGPVFQDYGPQAPVRCSAADD